MCRKGHEVMILYIYHSPKADSYMAHSRFPLEPDSAVFLNNKMGYDFRSSFSPPFFHPYIHVLPSFPLYASGFFLIPPGVFCFFFFCLILYQHPCFHLILSIFSSSSLSLKLIFIFSFFNPRSVSQLLFSVFLHKSLQPSPLTCHSLPISHLHLNLCTFTSTLPSSSSPSIILNVVFHPSLIHPSFNTLIPSDQTGSHSEETEQTSFRIRPWVLPFKWILTQPLLVLCHPLIAFFFHQTIHPFIPVPSFMTGLSADINQLREKIPR